MNCPHSSASHMVVFSVCKDQRCAEVGMQIVVEILQCWGKGAIVNSSSQMQQFVCLFIIVVVQLLSRVWLLYDSTDCSLPGFSVHGISQARILEWVVISFSRESSRLRGRTHISCTGRRTLYHWATREGLGLLPHKQKEWVHGRSGSKRTTPVIQQMLAIWSLVPVSQSSHCPSNTPGYLAFMSHTSLPHPYLEKFSSTSSIHWNQ